MLNFDINYVFVKYILFLNLMIFLEIKLGNFELRSSQGQNGHSGVQVSKIAILIYKFKIQFLIRVETAKI